jgi:hypothetical protein
MGHGLEGRGWIPDRGKIISLSTESISTLGPAQPLVEWLPGRTLFRGEIGRGMKLINHFRLVPRSRMVEVFLHSSIRLYGVVIN